jgi:hypothetical protein
MTSKKVITVEIIQVSRAGSSLTRKHRKVAPVIRTEATFSRTGTTCYWQGKVLTRVHGSHWSGGNYVDEDGNGYVVMRKLNNF